MSESLICLKTVYDLRVDASDKPFRYHIPAYQRGYRWTPTQVTQLLDDVREFTKRENPQQEEFYCLQPLVLRPNNDGAYEVVDGTDAMRWNAAVFPIISSVPSHSTQSSL